MFNSFDRLFVRMYGNSFWLDPKAGEERSRHGPLYLLFQDDWLKARGINSLTTNKLNWTNESERNYLMLRPSICRIWRNKSNIKNFALFSLNAFVNCVYTRNQFLKFLLRIRYKLSTIITHSFPMHPFSTPLLYSFLMFSAGRERVHWGQIY